MSERVGGSSPLFSLSKRLRSLILWLQSFEVGCEKVCPFRVKRVSFLGKKTLFFDENLKLCNGKVKEFFWGNEFFGYITTELSVLSFI